MFLYLSSQDCKQFYPDNSAVDFIIELPQTVTGTYLLLQHVYYRKKEAATKQYYFVLCDLVESSVVAGREVRVLGTFFQKGSLDCSQSLRLANRSFKRLRIRILTADFKVPEDLSAVFLTLKLI